MLRYSVLLVTIFLATPLFAADETEGSGVGHTREVTAVAVDGDGRLLASASKDRTVRLWDVATGLERATLPSPSGAIFSVCFAPDGQTVAAGCDNGVGRLWDAAGEMERA